MTVFRATFFLAFALAFSACDSAGGSDSATVTIDLLNVSTTGNCDSATNPGDFQFYVEVLDEGNQRLDALDLPVGARYGTHAEGTFISLFAGDEAPIDQTISFERPREDGGGFAIQFSAMEWDSSTLRDGALDDRSTIQLHTFRDGRFANVVGERSARVFGNSSCNATLAYNVTVQ